MAKKKRPTIPVTHAVKIGTMAVQKGLNNEGEQTYSWDVVQKCMHENCPALDTCHYEAHVESDGICKVLKAYIRSATLVLYNEQKDLSAAQRFQVGMHIMPLYKILCKLKIEEVGVVRAVTTNSRGTLVVNPLYKEIRETIKTIDVVWRSIGVQGAKRPNTSPTFGDGSSNYYDKMEAEALEDM